MATGLIMKTIRIIGHNAITPLGDTTEKNYVALQQGKSGIARTSFPGIADQVCLGKITDSHIADASLTRFENLLIRSIQDALTNTPVDIRSPRTVLIFSTTKGNVELLGQVIADDQRLYLSHAAQTITTFLKNPNAPIVVSNACTSGVVAMLTGKYMLESGQYDHAVIAGADVLSSFIISGFQSLHALSDEVCQPFDKQRKGINLGEAAATVVLSSERGLSSRESIKIGGGGMTNDANHISGPSRTGEELSAAISKALRQSGVTKEQIDFISAHGTATLYNDEMEANAFHLSGLHDVPVNSLKGFFGHTLGAAGILESVMSIRALQHNELTPSYGFQEPGVSKPITIIRERKQLPLSVCLKTASGFGGCNAAMILQKDINEHE